MLDEGPAAPLRVRLCVAPTDIRWHSSPRLLSGAANRLGKDAGLFPVRVQPLVMRYFDLRGNRSGCSIDSVSKSTSRSGQ